MINAWSRWRSQGLNRVVLFAYAALIGVFFYTLAQFYLPGKGFSYLIAFGGKQEVARVGELRPLDYYVQRDSDGYDAQYYAQIAMHPSLRDPQLKSAVDSLPYRARRILICWTSYALGFGRPALILQAYALQNAIAWLALAFVLLAWFPPTSWSNFFRWMGVQFSFGMCVSLRNSLIDGPSLLLIALGVLAVERNRPWLGAAVFAVSGLGKETNLLAASSLIGAPPDRPGRGRRLFLQAVLIGAPLALWLLYIQWRVGPATDLGARNFNLPLVSYFAKWHEALVDLHRPELGGAGGRASLFMLIALTVQFLFFVVRPSPKQPWWRVGMSFAVLMLVLGDAVWEGYPGAASRVLLPMQLAFNVLVPRSPAWLPVLVLGNLTFLGAPDALQPPLGDGYILTGPHLLAVNPADGGRARVTFSPDWYDAERSVGRYWRWSRGSGTFTIHNPQKFPVMADITFYADAALSRALVVRVNGQERWRGQVGRDSKRIELTPYRLDPGDTTIALQTSEPARPAGPQDPRLLAIALRNLDIRLLRMPHASEK